LDSEVKDALIYNIFLRQLNAVVVKHGNDFVILVSIVKEFLILHRFYFAKNRINVWQK